MLLFATSIFADEIKWAKDFDSGIKMAQKENKPVLFVFSRHTCKYCVILEETTFSDPRVIKELNKDFVSIIAYSDENDAMPQELWRPGTPTIWFLLPSGQPMYQPLMGAVGEDNFLQALSIVEKEFIKINTKSGK
jgi:thioredoxin-related protein